MTEASPSGDDVPHEPDEFAVTDATTSSRAAWRSRRTRFVIVIALAAIILNLVGALNHHDTPQPPLDKLESKLVCDELRSGTSPEALYGQLGAGRPRAEFGTSVLGPALDDECPALRDQPDIRAFLATG